MLCVPRPRLPAFLSVAALIAMTAAVSAQSGDPRAGDQQRAAQAEAAKDAAKKPDEFSEAARVLGGPASEPECVWLGRRAVNLLWRDDLDTAYRHLGLYDRFGCPGPHLQATFRCVVRQGSIDPKMQESLGTRVHACWINPNLEPQPAAAPAAPGAAAQGQAAPPR